MKLQGISITNSLLTAKHSENGVAFLHFRLYTIYSPLYKILKPNIANLILQNVIRYIMLVHRKIHGEYFCETAMEQRVRHMCCTTTRDTLTARIHSSMMLFNYFPFLIKHISQWKPKQHHEYLKAKKESCTLIEMHT